MTLLTFKLIQHLRSIKRVNNNKDHDGIGQQNKVLSFNIIFHSIYTSQNNGLATATGRTIYMYITNEMVDSDMYFPF